MDMLSGETKKGRNYFHMTIKLNRIKWCLLICQYLRQKWSVNVHFSNRNVNYYSAWFYTMKIKNFLSHPVIQIWLIWCHLKHCQSVKLVWSEEEEGIEGQEPEEGGSSSTSRGSSSRSAKQRRSRR